MAETRFDYDDAARTAEHIRGRLKEEEREEGSIREGLTLGSGLGGFVADHMSRDEAPLEIPFEEIFALLNRVEGRPTIEIPEHKVPGHAQRLIIGHLTGTNENDLILAQSGREHPYEGVSLKRSTFWLRVMQLLQAEAWIGSNASGVLTPDTLTPPAIVLVESALDMGNDNPLYGPNDDRFGPRFPHQSDLYSAAALADFEAAAKAHGISIQKGMYVRLPGPEYENPETVYRLRGVLRNVWEEAGMNPDETRFRGPVIGVVGMSSTYEALVAKHASQSTKHPAFTRGISLLSATTNYSGSVGPKGFVGPSNHDEVKREALGVQENFGRLVREGMIRMRNDKK